MAWAIISTALAFVMFFLSLVAVLFGFFSDFLNDLSAMAVSVTLVLSNTF